MAVGDDEVIGKPLRRATPSIANGWEFAITVGKQWGFPAIMCLMMAWWIWYLTTSHQSSAADAHKIFEAAMAKQADTLATAIREETAAIKELGAEQKITNQKLTEVDAALDAHLRNERRGH